MKLGDLINFYKPPFRYVRLGDYTGCTSDRIEDADGFVLIEIRPDLFPNSEQHDTAHMIAAALTEQANAMLKVVPTPASILAAEDGGGAVAPDGTLSEDRDEWRGGGSYEASMLRNLLARIHRDGGHYLEAHGLDKALEDADTKVSAWLSRDVAWLSFCKTLMSAMADIVGLPTVDDSARKETLDREAVMQRVMRIRRAFDDYSQQQAPPSQAGVREVSAGAIEWPSIDEVCKAAMLENAEFSAWRNSVPDKYWVRLDLSALRVGYELGGAVMRRLFENDDRARREVKP